MKRLLAGPPPDAAHELFGPTLPTAIRFAELLADEAAVRGLIGPREVPRLWERHLLNCVLLDELIPASSSVADIGTGAGLPGIVLAIRRPELQVCLIEPLLRRTKFLDQAVAELELGNAEVVRSRAEQLAGSRTFDVVTSRAVAPMERLAGWSLPLTRAGGLFLAMKGSAARAETEVAESTIREFGGTLLGVETLGSGVVAEPATIVKIRRDA